MSTMTKVFIVLTAVLAIVLSCLTIASAAQWSNAEENIRNYQKLADAETVRRMNTEAVLATSLAIKDDTIKSLRRELANTQAESRRLADELATVRNDLAREENAAVAAEAGRKKLEEILAVQTAELTATRKQNEELVSQNIDLQTRNQRLSARVLELTSQTTVANEQNRNLQEKLYACEQAQARMQKTSATGGQYVAEEAATGVTAVSPTVVGPIRGEVVEIDGRYVSLNVGSSSGVVEGMTFMIYRGSTYVGDVEIETVRPHESGGRVTMQAPGQQIARGDFAEYGLNAQ